MIEIIMTLIPSSWLFGEAAAQVAVPLGMIVGRVPPKIPKLPNMALACASKAGFFLCR
jgi:hypothetical protein